ncbi:MAG: PAS domain-containing protein [Alphaproteobacteria bacterium]|nr:PAS domain-containing protein [Alphaproteobacteria bacterium]
MANTPIPSDAPAAFNAEAEAKGWYYRSDPALVFARSELHAIAALWREKADATGGLPARADFDIRALKPFLRNVAFLEKIGGRYRFRLFGSALVHLFGERTGQYLDEMTSPTLLANWTAVYEMILAHGGPVRVFNHKLSPILNGEMFAAPLAPDAGGHPMVMVAAYVALKEAMP